MHPLSRFRRTLCLLALGTSLLLSGAASAQDYATRNLGLWTVSASGDRKGCLLTRTYQGPGETTLLLGLDADNSNRLTIINANWSIREKDQLRLNFVLSHAAFPRHLAIGIEASGKRGFAAQFGAAFPTTFATSSFLHIQRDKVPVDELDLNGSSAAVAELRKCVDLYRRTPARVDSRTRQDSRIPIDPFAPEASRKSAK